jgi:fructoselysine-6-P-deglycase FrlB-like protein
MLQIKQIRAQGAGVAHIDTEIASQPSCWRRAAEIAGTEPAGLPRSGERVAVVGCGTSLFVAQAYAVRREQAGAGETDAFAASEFPLGRRYDRVLLISRSGTTTEVLALLDRIDPTIAVGAITGDGAAPLAARVADTVVLDFADERSVVQTRFATSALALLRAGLGDDVAALANAAEVSLAAPLPDGALGRTQFTFLGTGWTVGLANEAALKLREAAQAWTESYPAMEYRHGPISVTGPDSLVWVLGPVPAGLADQIAATGAQLVADDTDSTDAMVALTGAQRLAAALATARGLHPDEPRNLTRSVILT